MQTLTRDIAAARIDWLVSLTADKADWPPWTSDQFMADLPGKWDLSFIGPHGVAIISTRPGQPHLHLLAVEINHRGMGHGSAMMAEAIRRGVRSLKVPGDAPQTVKFYRRHGFQFKPRWLAMEMAS